MKQYLAALQQVMDEGVLQDNRTGVPTLTVPGMMLKFDLRDGFPAVTTKKLFFDGVKGENIGFLRGTTSLKEFQSLGCNVWNANASADYWQNNPACYGPDDLGRIYGAQWRDYAGSDCRIPEHERGVDQIKVALGLLRNNPESRRILVNAWNPSELDKACLPPCHVLFQLLPHTSSKTLHMTMYQRSCDMFLGVPFNIASYALLLHLFAAWSGFEVGTLTMFLADAHIYTNHVDQVREQLSRNPLPLPQLDLDIPNHAEQLNLDTLLMNLGPSEICLVNYSHHPAIKAPMAT